MSLGTWPLTTDREREALAFLIAHLPADGRYEVEIRPTQGQLGLDDEVARLRAENADLKQRLDEGVTPL